MIREVEPGSLVVDQFPVFDEDGYSKKAGLTQGAGDFTVTVWREAVPVPVPVVISEIVTTPGEYQIQWTPTLGVIGRYEIQVLIDFNKDTWHGEYLTVPSNDRILGLLHENAMVDNQTYDGLSQLLSGRLRVFDTAAHVPTAAGGSETLGLKYEYEIEAEYDGLNKLTKYVLKRVL